MITEEQRKRLDYAHVAAILTRDYKASYLNYILTKGSLVKVTVCATWKNGMLHVNGKIVDYTFPYDAAELLDTTA